MFQKCPQLRVMRKRDPGNEHAGHRTPKSKRGERRVPLVDRAREVLEEWREVGIHERIVFPDQGYSRPRSAL